MRVEPGVANLDVSKAIGAAGYYYAPDPSSPERLLDRRQRRGELRRRALPEVRLHDQPRARRAARARRRRASWTWAARCSTRPATTCWACSSAAKGCSASSPRCVLRVLRKPQATRTFFATFPSTDEAGNAVSAIIASGIVPAAIEMMDRLAIVAAKAATGLDWPDVGAALLMDVDGPDAEVESTSDERRRAGARGRGDRDPARPTTRPSGRCMWKGRKSAFAAVGRISPNYFVQDGVIPRSEIAEGPARDRRARRREPGCASPTSSTRATATSTRWSSTTRRSPGRRRPPRKSGARS